MNDEAVDPKQPESVAAVLKVFAILQALSEHNESGISELSVRLAMPKATIYRFLQTMKSLGFVRQESSSERYGLTMKMFELGSKALQYPDLVELAREPMQQLAELTGETVHLGMLIDSEIIYVHKVDSSHMLGMYSRVGRRAPLHCTAIGKVLVAWGDAARRERILKGYEFKAFRDKTIVNRADFEAELQRTRTQGFAQDREEFDEHIRCVAVPVFDRLKQPLAGISVSFPSFRFYSAREPEVVAMLQRASRVISKQLGCEEFPLDAAASAQH